jgi:RNA polymerase sigma-70 factor (ECF subfamily)
MLVSSLSEGFDRCPGWPQAPLALSGAEGLFEVYASRVYSLARRLLGQEGGAEGVALGVLVQAARQFRPTDSQPDPELPARLLRATVAASLAARRPTTTAARFRTEPTPTCPTRAQRLEARGGPSICPVGVLEELLADLPAALRDCFILADVEGLPLPEVAALLGLGPSEARQRLHWARLRLARALGGPGK